VRAVIGKGGMGPKTLRACREHGAVYLHAIGGAAQVYADRIQGVQDVFLEEFGSPEAIWALTVEDFPAIVTMDAQGNSLHEVVQQESLDRLKEALAAAGPPAPAPESAATAFSASAARCRNGGA
jgi:fumarate hydratase class I